MSTWIGSLPYFKILPFFVYVIIYFNMTGAHMRYPDENYWTVLFKLLPVMSLVFMVLSCASQNDEHARLKKFVAAGLLFSMLGDVCLVWRITLFIPGLLFFAIAHGIYVCGYKMEPFGPMPAFVLCAVLGIATCWYLQEGIRDPVMKQLVFTYASLIFLMGWRIMVRLLDNYNPGNLCGFVGAVLFICSDFMIGVDKFRYPVKDASLRIMLTYYLGQLGIALSACYNPQRVDARNLNGKVD